MTANRATDVSEAGDVWHYAVGSERRGPVPRTTIAKLLASGEISAETYVWQQGMDNWVHLGDAGPLKPLVTGLEGDGLPEDFVEEDTAFTSADQLRASHHFLDIDESGVSGDTVIETLESVMASGHLANLAGSPAAAGPSRSSLAGSPMPAPASTHLSAIVSSAGGAQSASGSDIFAASEPGGPGSEGSDIFGVAGPSSEEEGIAGVHGRRQSSVLFSLDELGREESRKATGPKDGFVTDSSGLIDIKAIATNTKSAEGDPFSGANLVIPPRGSSSPMSVPIVERRRGAGPWILASAALVVIGGGIIAFVVATGGKDDVPTNPPVVAEKDPSGGQVAKVDPGKADPGKADPGKADPAKTDPSKVVAGDPPKTDEKKADPAADAAKVGEPPVVDPNAKTADAAKVADAKTDPPKTEVKPLTPEEKKKAADAKKAAEERAAEAKKLADEKKVAEVVPVPAVKDNGTAGKKVEDLLNKLKPGQTTAKVEETKSNEDLPDKLSAAVVRAAIRGKFGRCGAMITGATGSVTVQTQFVISSSGVVQLARVTDPQGTSGDVQGCVTGAIKDTTFGRFKDATMTVNLPVKLL